jgi:hypothetical protein
MWAALRACARAMGDKHVNKQVRTSAAAVISLLVAIGCYGRALADTSAAASPSPSSSSKSHWSVDPCSLLGANDLTEAVGAVNPPRRPSTDECLWSAATNQHTPRGVSQVLLTVDAADQAKNGCKGLNCVYIVRAITGYIPGLDRFNSTVDTLGSTAILIKGLGQKAAWGHGILAVLENNTIFKVQLSGTQSDMLSASELLAQKVLANMGSH